jgi:tRNA 2-selenouridine synthase
MIRYETLSDVSAARLERYDMILDVRSPSEHAEDHLPGAVNLPVLDDRERAEIGTTYVQVSPFEARRAGAALVARNAAHHLRTTLADKPKRFRPLVYCWRGGMRSNSMATILAAVGWPVAVLEGGYQTWRRAVIAGLDAACPTLDLVLIDGQTGTGKTALLQVLHEKGAQVLDLEGLARHRGSAFGGFDDEAQPAQKAFESRLWRQIEGFEPGRPVYVEAESARIGLVRLPAALWTRMKTAPRLEIVAPLAERARFLAQSYADIVADPDRVEQALDLISPFHARDRIAHWRELARMGQPEALALELMQAHYDPAYDRSRNKRMKKSLATLQTERLDAEALDALADKILSTPLAF